MRKDCLPTFPEMPFNSINKRHLGPRNNKIDLIALGEGDQLGVIFNPDVYVGYVFDSTRRTSVA